MQDNLARKNFQSCMGSYSASSSKITTRSAENPVKLVKSWLYQENSRVILLNRYNHSLKNVKSSDAFPVEMQKMLVFSEASILICFIGFGTKRTRFRVENLPWVWVLPSTCGNHHFLVVK